MTVKLESTFGRSQGIALIVIKLTQELNSMCRKKNHPPIPLRYTDVVMRTTTTVDVLLESLSEPWKGFTQFTMLDEKRPHIYTWSGRRLTKIQAPSRPDHSWPEMWSRLTKAAQRREEQQWAIGKSKLDKARKLRGIFFYRSGRYGVQGNHEKTRHKVGTVRASRNAFVRFKACSAGKPVAKNRTLPDQDMHASSKLVSLRQSAWVFLPNRVRQHHK